jgi:hypothetical protein
MSVGSSEPLRVSLTHVVCLGQRYDGNIHPCAAVTLAVTFPRPAGVVEKGLRFGSGPAEGHARGGLMKAQDG